MSRAWAIAALIAFFAVGDALACSCNPPNSIEEQIADSDAIFLGAAMGTRWIDSFDEGVSLIQSTKFRVWEKLKGDFEFDPEPYHSPTYVFVRHDRHLRGNCGLDLWPGIEYEVFATSYKNHLYTSKCHFTRLQPIPEYASSWADYKKALKAN